MSLVSKKKRTHLRELMSSAAAYNGLTFQEAMESFYPLQTRLDEITQQEELTREEMHRVFPLKKKEV